MPVVIRIFGYKIYFWSNEGKPLEPLHVHIAKRPAPNGTKAWLLSTGKIKLENNNSNIPKQELVKILKTIEVYYDIIESEWKNILDKSLIMDEAFSLERAFSFAQIDVII